MNARKAHWEALQTRHVTERVARTVDVLTLLRAVAVDMHGLENSDGWRRYLEMASARQAEDQAAHDALTAQLGGSAYLPPDALGELRLTLALTRARLDARRELLDLPRVIVAEGAKAEGVRS